MKRRGFFPTLALSLCTFFVHAQSGMSLLMDGVNDYAEISSYPEISAGDFDEFAVECWIRPSTISGRHTILSKNYFNGPTDNAGWKIVQNGNTVDVLCFNNDVQFVPGTRACLTAGQWSHIGMEISFGVLSLYVDGKLVAEGFPMPGYNAAASLKIGKADSLGSAIEFFAGAVDELRYWNAPRGLENFVAAQYREQLPNRPGLMGYWRFNESSGSTLINQISIGLNGEVFNLASFSLSLEIGHSSGRVYSSAPVALGYDGPGGVGGREFPSNLGWWLDPSGTVLVDNSTGTNKTRKIYDASPYKNNITQIGSLTLSPIYNAANANLNNKVTIDFNTNYMSSDSATPDFSTAETFAMLRPMLINNGVPYAGNADPGVTLREMLMFTAGSLRDYRVATTPVSYNTISTATAGTALISNRQLSLAGLKYKTNNGSFTSVVSANAGLPSDTYTFGARLVNGDPLNSAIFQMGDVIYYTQHLSDAQREIVNSAIAGKYALTISNDKYVGNENSFSFNIAGLGIESEGAHGVITSGGVTLANVNALDNPGSYIMIGHNGQIGLASTEVPNSISQRLVRSWYVDNSLSAGGAGQYLDITFNLPEAGAGSLLPTDPNEYELLFRAANAGIFRGLDASDKIIIGGNLVRLRIEASELQDGYITLGTTAGSGTLPSLLFHFDAELKNGKSILTWESTDNTTVAKYMVERSRDGINFETLGAITPDMGSANRTYVFADDQPGLGNNFYRLRMLSHYQQSSYSDRRKIRIDIPQGSMKLYPNPSSNYRATFEHPALGYESKIYVYDFRGILVAEQTVPATEAATVLSYPKLAAGNYIISWQDQEISRSVKWIIK